MLGKLCIFLNGLQLPLRAIKCCIAVTFKLQTSERKRQSGRVGTRKKKKIRERKESSGRI